MDRIKLIALSLILFLSVNAFHGIAQATPAVFPPITSEQLDIFLDSIRSNRPLIVPPAKVSQQVDPNVAGIWAGSTTKVNLDVRGIVLRFRKDTDELVTAAQTGDLDSNKLLDQFDISIDAGDLWITVAHSEPEKRLDVGGFRIRADRPSRETRNPFIMGQQHSGAYIIIPPFSDSRSVYGMLICPRKLSKSPGGRSTEYQLTPSPYELSEIFIRYEASVEASMATAGQEALTKATLSLSKNLPESLFSEDRSVSAIPRVAVSYKPKSKFDFFRFAPFDAIQEGGIVEVEMLNRAGYQRKQFFSHALYVSKFLEPSPLAVVADGKKIVNDTGECYSVVDYQYGWTEYVKLSAQDFAK